MADEPRDSATSRVEQIFQAASKSGALITQEKTEVEVLRDALDLIRTTAGLHATTDSRHPMNVIMNTAIIALNREPAQ